jgi:methionyl-tRNA formyltransferase
MRTVYMGTSAFAVDVLETLAASPHRPALVVTPPDRPKGRGRRVGSPPVADAARRLAIDLLQVASVNEDDAVAAIGAAAPEAIGVCEFGQLIKEPLLSRYLLLNVHPSLLPRWRGAAPIERALMAGDEETGMTIFEIVAGLDSGPVALVTREPVLPDDSFGTLAKRLSALGGKLLVEAFDLVERGELELAPQSGEGVTYASKIEPGERRLDPGRGAQELELQVRALTPHVGAYLELDGGERLGVTSVRRADASLEPGELRSSDGRLLLGCADRALELVEVKPPGKRAMPASDFLRGHSLPARAAS